MNVKKEVTIFFEDGKFYNETKHNDEVVSMEDVTEYYKTDVLKTLGENGLIKK